MIGGTKTRPLAIVSVAGVTEPFLTLNRAERLRDLREKFGRKTPRARIEYNPECNGSKLRWVENIAEGLRVTAAHDVDEIRLGHKGWYCDSFESDTIHGLVIQLPTREKGCPRYLAGYSDAWNDGCGVVDFSDNFDTPSDAAHAADSMAQNAAEKMRWYDEAWQKGSACAEALNEADETRADLATVRRECRAAGALIKKLPKDLRATLREKAATLKQAVADLEAKAEKLRDEFEHCDGFKDGFSDNRNAKKKKGAK